MQYACIRYGMNERWLAVSRCEGLRMCGLILNPPCCAASSSASCLLGSPYSVPVNAKALTIAIPLAANKLAILYLSPRYPLFILGIVVSHSYCAYDTTNF